MRPTVIAVALGLLTVAFACVGLLNPGLVIGFVGYGFISTSKQVAVLSEVRAVYGGLFLVVGLYTLFAGFNPSAHRSRLLFIGLMWLGLCSGRILGISIDGSPGFNGWASAVLELLMGTGLLVASRATPPASAAAESREAA